MDLIINLLTALKSVIEMELSQSHENNEKQDILQNTMKSMEHMLILLKQTGVDIDRDIVLAMFRGYVS
jgi:hypothetical protein